MKPFVAFPYIVITAIAIAASFLAAIAHAESYELHVTLHPTTVTCVIVTPTSTQMWMEPGHTCHVSPAERGK